MANRLVVSSFAVLFFVESVPVDFYKRRCGVALVIVALIVAVVVMVWSIAAPHYAARRRLSIVKSTVLPLRYTDTGVFVCKPSHLARSAARCNALPAAARSASAIFCPLRFML